ncbi:MAG: hypothetical protein M3421_08115 [Bacteroidota bacterium]|nr:hypothetical protein [Bacteroidota bacterium]
MAQGLCKDVLACPLYNASVSSRTSLLSVPRTRPSFVSTGFCSPAFFTTPLQAGSSLKTSTGSFFTLSPLSENQLAAYRRSVGQQASPTCLPRAARMGKGLAPLI